MGWGADDQDSIDSGTDPASAAQSTADSYGGSDNNDDSGFFSGTFDNPGEPGFSGPSYSGQVGTDSAGDYWGYSDIGMDEEIDRIAAQFTTLDDLYEETYGSFLGFGGQRGTIAMDATGSMMGFSPFGERVGAEEAQFASRVQGLYGTAAEIGLANRPAENLVGKVADVVSTVAGKVASRFGTDPTKDYVVDMSSGYIGQVFDDYSLSDLTANVLGLAVPGGVKMDRALTMDITGRGMGARDYASSTSMFGKHTSVMTPEEREAQIAEAMAAKPTDSDFSDRFLNDPEYRASVLSATPRSPYLRRLLEDYSANIAAPSFYDSAEPAFRFFGSEFFREGGEVEKKAGGGMAADKYDEQMYGALSEKPRPNLDPVAVKQNPESFMMNPLNARNANELREIYAYNQDIMTIASQPLKAQEGMQVGQPEAQPSGDGPVGFVGKKTPETLPEAKTVADDVPLDVEEGTFILNAAAVEFAGSDDVKKMILEAIDEARRQGVDISGDENKIDRENAVSLLVSEGEVVIPPLLAKIIGYDKLNKINNRGKQEVEKRVEENGQSPEAEAIDEAPVNPAEGMAMYDGGMSVSGQGSSGPNATTVNLQGSLQKRDEETGEGFAVRPRVNYDERTNTQEFPDGVIVNEKGKSIGFAIDGQMFLSDDTSLRAGIEQQKNKFEGSAKLPAEYGGETIEFGGGSKMKRYNMGATFGPVDVDISKTQTPEGPDVMGGSVRYRFSENGDVTLEATDDGRSGRVGLNYRF